MRSLITGVDGFIGSWLAEALIAAGDDVHGLSRADQGQVTGIVRHGGDVGDAARLEEVVRAAAPDRVFHLAAQNNVSLSFADPRATVASNVHGSINVLEAVRRHAPGARVVSVGSSAEYGQTAAASASIEEEMPLLPTSPYGISKVAQGLFCSVYAKVYGLRVCHVRPFAIVGPRKRGDALGEFCKSLVEIERGRAGRLPVGDLESYRDFVDVRDSVAALVLVSEMGSAGAVYNVCNGRAVSLEDVLEILRGLAERSFETTADSSRLRPADDKRIVGSNDKIRALGYAPRYELPETVRLTLLDWRRRTPP